MTIRAMVLECLRTADRPLRQADVAHRIGKPAPSVRREMQVLERTKQIIVAGWDQSNYGTYDYPKFAVAETGR